MHFSRLLGYHQLSNSNLEWSYAIHIDHPAHKAQGDYRAGIRPMGTCLWSPWVLIIGTVEEVGTRSQILDIFWKYIQWAVNWFKYGEYESWWCRRIKGDPGSLSLQEKATREWTVGRNKENGYIDSYPASVLKDFMEVYDDAYIIAR